MACSKLIYLDATRPALWMALFIVSLDFSLIECRSDFSDGSWVQGESLKGRGSLTRQPSAPGVGAGGRWERTCMYAKLQCHLY